MAVIERIFAPRALRGRLANRSWLGQHVRVSAIEMTGFLWDGAHLPRPPDDGRAYLVVPLLGAVRLVDSGVVVRPGEAMRFPSAVATFDQRVVIAAPHRALALRIDRSFVVDADATVVFGAHFLLAAAEAVFSALRAERPFAAPLTALMRSLERAQILEGDPLASDNHDENDDPTANALSRALTLDATRPAMVDVAKGDLAFSERHTRRRIDAFLRRHHMPFARWRDLQQSFTLTGAALTLTLPHVGSEQAARAVGFASATGLCHAFKRAGLDAPQEIARATADLAASLA